MNSINVENGADSSVLVLVAGLSRLLIVKASVESGKIIVKIQS